MTEYNEFTEEDFTLENRFKLFIQTRREFEELERLGLSKEEYISEAKMKLDYLLDYEDRRIRSYRARNLERPAAVMFMPFPIPGKN